MGYGAPDSLEAVEPFLTNLMGGLKPSSQQLEKVKERYRVIGGKSPFLNITRQQAKTLEIELNKSSKETFKVYIGMRYWHPLIEEAIREIVEAGIKELIVLTLSPFYSRITTGAYFQEVEQVLKKMSNPLSSRFIKDWYLHPLFIEAWVEKIKEGLKKFSPELQENVQFLFSTHSLPKRYVEEGDPYVMQYDETVGKIHEIINPAFWHLAYQSRGGQGEWLEPDVSMVLERIARKGFKEVLLIPLGFISDHVETLYDIDIIYRQQAESLGLNFHRCACLNLSPTFIKALVDIVLSAWGDNRNC